jgi:hypothetical protein
MQEDTLNDIKFLTPKGVLHGEVRQYIYGKTRPKSPGKILRKRGKVKKNIYKYFFSKDTFYPSQSAKIYSEVP